MNNTEEICYQIVSEVAEEEDCSIMDLNPLVEVINTDALEKLFASNLDKLRKFVFEYEGYTVIVEGQGEVTLE